MIPEGADKRVGTLALKRLFVGAMHGGRLRAAVPTF